MPEPQGGREALDVADGGVSERLSMLRLADSAGEAKAPSGALKSTFASAPVAPADGPSLMEQMMQEGLAYRAEQVEKTATEERRMKKTFGKGLKKGFLSSSPASSSGKGAARKDPAKAAAAAPSSGSAAINLNSAKHGRPSATGAVTTVTAVTACGNGAPGGAGGSASREAGMVLPEVQDAMRADNPLAADLRKGEWMTPELLQQVAGNPRLATALRDPRFCRALELMAKDPPRAMALLQDDEEARKMLGEFGAVLGQHFEKLAATDGPTGGVGNGNGNGSSSSGGKNINNNSSKSGSGGGGGGDGSAAAAAAPLQAAGRELPPISQEEQARVDAVLADKELRSLLMDPEMQAVLQDCQNPGRLRFYMTQRPDIAAKIRRLGDAGLVRLE